MHGKAQLTLKNRFRHYCFLYVFFLNALVLSLFFPGNSLAANKPQLVVSLAPQKFFVERIAQGLVDVVVLATPGSDPHTFEPNPAQMRACAKADCYLTIGAPFEDAWLPRLRSASPNLHIVSTISEIRRHAQSPEAPNLHDEPNSGLHSAEATHFKEHNHNEDPHVWLAPNLVSRMIPIISRELSRLLPEKHEEIAKNASAFQEEIASLQSEIQKLFATVPLDKRAFMTFHPAWHYFADEFGLTELSIENDGKEPSAKGMKNIIDQAKKYQIKIIFIEPQFPKNAAKAIATNIKAQISEADPLQEDWPALMRSFSLDLAHAFTQ